MRSYIPSASVDKVERRIVVWATPYSRVAPRTSSLRVALVRIAKFLLPESLYIGGRGLFRRLLK